MLVFSGPKAVNGEPPLFYTDFSDPPDEELWEGDFSSFRTEQTGNGWKLRLDAPSGESTARLATRHSYNPVMWEWYLRQNFAPSNNNRAFFFLDSDTSDLSGPVNGLAIRTGENGTPKHFRIQHFTDGIQAEELLISDVEIEADQGYRLRVIRTPGNELHLYVAKGYSGVPLLQSQTIPLAEIETTLSGHFGFRTHFTATRSDQFYFGDVLLSSALPLPGILEVSVLNSDNIDNPDNNATHETEIKVVFNVPPDATMLRNELFQLDNGTTPVQTECSHPQVCILRFQETLASGERSLTIHSYNTIYGQKAGEDQVSFIIAQSASAGDLIINEFMYNPPGDLPQYVELYNRSDNIIDLKNWRLQRRALASEPEREMTVESRFVFPEEYIVITSDASMLGDLMDAENILVMESFPRFNTASVDKIRLFSENVLLIDSLEYNPSVWGGDGVALERKSPEVPGWLEINWAESLDPKGGTPGFANSVTIPDDPPELRSYDYTHPEKIILHFDQFLDTGIENSDHFTLTLISASQAKNHFEPASNPVVNYVGENLTIPVSTVRKDDYTIEILPEERLSHGHKYRLEVSGLMDIFGNIMSHSEFTFTYFDIESPGKNDIVINEILYRPDDTGNRRFIELLNRSENVFDLREWQIGRSLGNPTPVYHSEITEPVYFTPGAKVVISEPGLVTSAESVLHITMDNFPSFSRFGDSTYLLSANGTLVDSIRYLPEWGANSDGVSLERIDPLGSGLDPANWVEHPENHSAGYRNFHFDAEPDPPEAIYAEKISPYAFRIVFNRFVKKESLNQIFIGERKATLSAEDTIHGQNLSSEFTFRSDQEILRQQKKVIIKSIQDAAGRISDDHFVSLSFAPRAGDIVINEIMYQPISERYSSKQDQSEYLEMWNRSGITLQLHGIHLHDLPDKNGSIQKTEPVVTENLSLPPEEFAVIYPDTSSHFESSRLFRAFDIAQLDETQFLRTDRLTLGFSTQGDHIYLAGRNGLVLDSIEYHPSWHNPNIIDTRGISLERIHPDVATGDKNNWTSNTTPEGGTPGYSNSVVIREKTSGYDGIVLSPNPFAPTGDGSNDHLVIKYELDDPDYLIHVRIFDRQGRLVRTLADGYRAGRKGKLIWDGRTDSGIMNRTGMYIIHFEAGDYANNQKHIYREVAVLARLP